MRIVRDLKRNAYDYASHLLDYTGASYFREYLRSRNKPNAVFIWIPKTAGTSLWTLLDAPKLKSTHLVKHRFTGKGIVTFGHMDYSQLVAGGYVPESFDKTAYKFAFVRNPYARAVSLYAYLKRTSFVPKQQSFLSFCRELRDQGCPPIGLYNFRGLSQCNPQAKWVENIEIDYVGRVEHIKNDADHILKKLGLPKDSVPQLNRTKHPGHHALYCKDSKAIVEELYEIDFCRFNYDFSDFL